MTLEQETEIRRDAVGMKRKEQHKRTRRKIAAMIAASVYAANMDDIDHDEMDHVSRFCLDAADSLLRALNE